MSLNEEVEEETGNVKNSYGININNLKINLRKKASKF